MNLVLYIHQDASQKGETLKTIIEQNFNETKIQTLQTFNAFKSRLKEVSVFDEKELFVLLADSSDRLNELSSLIDLLEGKRIILVLPDESKATLSRASKFFPRFFTPVSERYSVLCEVLIKMINQKEPTTN